MDRAGLVGDDGPTHHGAFDISFLSFIPNIVLLAPRDTTELREMAKFVAHYDDHPTAVRYPRGSSDDRLPESRTPIQLGKAEVLSEGSDVCIAAVGSMVSVAWEAASLLKVQGLEATVINARFIKPLDSETIVAAAKRCGALITIEENSRRGGFGEAVRDALHEAGLGGLPQTLISLPDQFIEHGAQPIIRKEAGLSAEAIFESALTLKRGSKAHGTHKTV